MEVQIISEEFIKPSSPTPREKRTLTLTLLDQIVPPIYAPIILYFNTTATAESITESLKQSLSTTLSHFYPFAGRIRDSLSIDCNDQGLLFVVVKHAYRLTDFLQNPDPNLARSHVRAPRTWVEPSPGDEVAMIQLNHFDCGGVAISAVAFHKITDASVIATFIKCWAGATRGLTETTVLPDFVPRSRFPPHESMDRESHIFSVMRRYFGYGNTVMRRYVFNSTAISKMRAGLAESQRRPTKVEIVSAFLWKCFMAASEAVFTDLSTSVVSHTVNLRWKAEPRLPQESFGNYIWLLGASCGNGEAERDLTALVGKVREAKSIIDVDFVKRMEGEKGFEGYFRNLEESRKGFVEKASYFSMASWCNIGFYEVDFGFGEVVWITNCDCGVEVEVPFLNTAFLLDTREGDGIEACVTLDERLFEEFDGNQELRDFALVNQSPLVAEPLSDASPPEIAAVNKPSEIAAMNKHSDANDGMIVVS